MRKAVANTNKITIKGPAKPIKTPPNLNSFCSSIPVLKAIALGGVETGRSKAQDELNAMIATITNGAPN